jgi:hypothetical protein
MPENPENPRNSRQEGGGATGRQPENVGNLNTLAGEARTDGVAETDSDANPTEDDRINTHGSER